MCGLVGMLGGGVQQADLAMMTDLAYVSGLRGLDATGIIQGKVTKWNKGDVFINKMAQEVSYWLFHNKCTKEGNKRVLNSIYDNMFLIHTRAGTIGGNTNLNAHPFATGNLISQHNGTLVDAKYRVNKDKTDSEQMFEDIEKRGLKAVIEELDPKSAFAIVSFNKETGEVTFIRNSLRPLYLAVNTERAVLYYASERFMLDLCARRNGVKIGDVMFFEPMRSYTFRPDEVLKDDIPEWRGENYFQPEPKAAAQVVVDKTPVNLTTLGPRITAVNKSVAKAGEDDKVVGILKSRPKDPIVTTVLNGSRIATTISGTPNKFAPMRIAHVDCKYCKKSLNLLEQYYASRQDNGKSLVCSDCTAKITQFTNEKAQQAAGKTEL